MTLLPVSFALRKEWKLGLVVQISHPCWLRKKAHKFKATLDNTARGCLESSGNEASNI